MARTFLKGLGLETLRQTAGSASSQLRAPPAQETPAQHPESGRNNEHIQSRARSRCRQGLQSRGAGHQGPPPGRSSTAAAKAARGEPPTSLPTDPGEPAGLSGWPGKASLGAVNTFRRCQEMGPAGPIPDPRLQFPRASLQPVDFCPPAELRPVPVRRVLDRGVTPSLSGHCPHLLVFAVLRGIVSVSEPLQG